MTKYLVFGHDRYHPEGGWKDLIAKCESIEEAAQAARDSNFDEVDIIDLETLTPVGAFYKRRVNGKV